MSPSMLLNPQSELSASPDGASKATLPQVAVDRSTRTETGKPPTADCQAAGWGLAQRILFRFALVYLALTIALFPLQILAAIFPGTVTLIGTVIQPYQDLWDAIVPWVGQHVFQVEVLIIRPNGSGDSTYDYVLTFCSLALATMAAAVWSLVDRKRASYPRLWELLRVSVRFYLAYVIIGYGVAKLTQFPQPSLNRLLQPFGDASPMGMLWTFMGASQPYTRFTGCVEVLGGLLLTTRRTTLLGALVRIGAFTQIVALNFCYDVPVKLFSSFLLALSIFLTLPDLRRLANFFLFNRATQPAAQPSVSGRKWLQVGTLVFRSLLVLGVFLGLQVKNQLEGVAAFKEYRAPSPLQGIWNVEEWTVDGQVQLLLVTNHTGWRRLVFDGPRVLTIYRMNDSRQYYQMTLDADKSTLKLSDMNDKTLKAKFTWSEPESGVLVLQGMLDGRLVRIQLRKVDESKFLLVNRGFHWINEMPFNR